MTRPSPRARLLAAGAPIAAVVIGLSFAVRPEASQGGAAAPSTLSGVYTGEQSARGAKVYAERCVSCHLEGLTGGSQVSGDVPALVGPSFVGGWRGMSVGELFDWVRQSMPPSGPELTPQQHADVLAFIFSRNKFPAGQRELPADVAALNLIAIEGSAAAAAAAPTPNRSVLDGVFTKAQSGRGEKRYAAACGSCHAATLSGNAVVPALAGAEFLGRWNRATVGDLFDRIRTAMPPDNPGGLSDAEYADIVAFLLDRNRFRAGATELAGTPETLRMIWLETAR